MTVSRGSGRIPFPVRFREDASCPTRERFTVAVGAIRVGVPDVVRLLRRARLF